MARDSEIVSDRDRLKTLSGKLIRLHKLLLDRQRGEYEEAHGPIRSTGEYLGLVLDNKAFAWLRELSRTIASVDETLALRGKASLYDADTARAEVCDLLQPLMNGNEFQRNYAAALNGSSEIGDLHREICPALISALTHENGAGGPTQDKDIEPK